MSTDLHRDRAAHASNPAEALGRSFDPHSASLAVRSVPSLVRYLAKANVPPSEGAAPASVFERTLEGADANDPNGGAGEPGAATTPPSLKAAGGDEVVFFLDGTSAQSATVDVWARTDLYTDAGDTTSRRKWVLVASVAVTPFVEYRVQSGRRDVFLRVRDTVGIGDGEPGNDPTATLHATFH